MSIHTFYQIRKMNTCTAHDLITAGQELQKDVPGVNLEPDFVLCPRDDISSPRLQRYLLELYNDMERQKELAAKGRVNRGQGK